MHLEKDRCSPVTTLAARANAFMIHHANKMVAAAAKLESHDPAAVSAVSRVRTRSEGKKKYPSGKGSNKPRQWKALGICYNHYYCPSVEAARTSSLQLSLVRFGGIHVLCDMQLVALRPFIPNARCRLVFEAFHGLSPGHAGHAKAKSVSPAPGGR